MLCPGVEFFLGLHRGCGQGCYEVQSSSSPLRHPLPTQWDNAMSHLYVLSSRTFDHVGGIGLDGPFLLVVLELQVSGRIHEMMGLDKSVKVVPTYTWSLWFAIGFWKAQWYYCLSFHPWDTFCTQTDSSSRLRMGISLWHLICKFLVGLGSLLETLVSAFSHLLTPT